MSVIDLDPDSNPRTSPPTLLANFTNTRPMEDALTHGVVLNPVPIVSDVVNAGVVPDSEAQQRLIQLQALYQQKQADLLLQFQQAQMHLARQHYAFFQQAIAKSTPDRGVEGALGPTPLSLSSSHSNLHSPIMNSPIVPGGISSLVSARSQPSLRQRVAATIQHRAQQDLRRPGEGSQPRMPLAPGSHNHVTTMSVDNIGAREPPTPLDLKTGVTGSSGAISDSTRERLRAVLQHKQTQKSQTNLNTLGGSQPIQLARKSTRNNIQIRKDSIEMDYHQSGSYDTNRNELTHVLSDYQLRKVSSEPNLKMRPVHRNRHSRSPPYTIPAAPNRVTSSQTNVNSSGSAFKPATQRITQNTAQSHTANKYPSTVFPSPSLPNLCSWDELGSAVHQAEFQQRLHMNLAAVMAQQGLGCNMGTQQLLMSMPSLQNYRPQLGGLTLPLTTTNSVIDNMSYDRARQMFDPRLTLSGSTASRDTSSLATKSILKQQLRDLVLRRKSLVREETDEEVNVNVVSCSAVGDKRYIRTGIAYDSSMGKHMCVCKDNKKHVEHGGRTHSIYARLLERGLLDMCDRIVARKASLEQLKLVHSETYVTFFAISPTACLKVDPSTLPLRSFVQLPCGGIGVDTDTYFNDSCTQGAARLAVGYLTELCTQVWDGAVRNGFAIIRPPGHHAERDLAMGFCFFNNVAVAVKSIMARPNAPTRIAIVDWDVHHGNGTQLAFQGNHNVLYLSIHRHDNGNFFPGTGAVTDVGIGEGKGSSVNIAWSGGTMGDAEYLAACRVVLWPVLTQFQPEFIVVSAGFDAAVGHSMELGGYTVSPQLFGYMTEQLCKFANGKVVLALEGGYDLTAICDSSEECVKALCVASSPASQEEGSCMTGLSEEALLTRPSNASQETLQKVVAIQKKFWTSLSGEGLRMSQIEWESGSSGGMPMGNLSIQSTSPTTTITSPIVVDDDPA